MPNPIGPSQHEAPAHRNPPLRLWQVLFLILVFVAAFLVRRVGLDFGRPLLTHPDEQNVILPVVDSVRLGHNVYKYAHPTQVLYRIDKAVLNGYSQLRHGINLAAWYDGNPHSVYLGARYVNALFGSLLPVLAFFIGRRFKPDFSIPAALLFAFFPQYVLHSHYITPDVPITFYTLAVLLACLLWLEGRGKAWLWAAAALAALNTLDKFPGVISLAMVAAAILIQARRARLPFAWLFRQGLTVLGIFLLTAFLVAPNLFLEFPTVLSAVINEARDFHLGNDGLNSLGKLAYYARVFWDFANPLILLFALLGAFGLARSRQDQACLLAYGLLYAALLSTLALHHERWALPMFITPLLLAAFGTAWLFERARGSTWLRALAWLAVGLMLALNGLKGLTESIYMDLPDTSAVGLHVLEEHNLRPDRMLYEGYTPFAPFGKPDIYGFDFANPGNIEFVMLSEKMYARYQAEPQRYARENAFYEKLQQNARLWKTWQPYPKPANPLGQLDLLNYYLQNRQQLSSLERYSGYTIKVYRLNPR